MKAPRFTVASRLKVWEVAYAVTYARICEVGIAKVGGERAAAEIAIATADTAVQALDDRCYEARKAAREAAGVKVVESE